LERDGLTAEPSDLLVKNLKVLDRIIRRVCRRHGMAHDDVEEFTASVRLRLIENDYSIIRRFSGGGPFEAYLTNVVKLLLSEDRVHRWGKWHDSAEAKRLGPVAVELERMIHRDGLPRNQAFVSLVARHPHLTVKEFDAIAERLPQRTKRPRTVSLDDINLEFVADEEPDVGHADRMALASRVAGIVRAALESLPASDRSILLLHFGQEMKIPEVARVLQMDQKRLYKQRDVLLRELHKKLKEAGVRRGDVADLIGRETETLDFGLGSRRIRAADDEPFPSETTETTRMTGLLGERPPHSDNQ
jgi:RNA polymerase sigma factor for flagellar operon FliA